MSASHSGDLDVLTFGEAMIRMSPPDFRRLEQTTSLDIAVGGAELNVAAGLCRLGLRAGWLSVLPLNPLGRMVLNKAREHGVDMRWVRWDDTGRVGLYFVEFGSSPRPSTVLYDRRHSSFSLLSGGAFDWASTLEHTRLLHTTGINPALSPQIADQVRVAVETAHAAGVLVTYDLNYRERLWTVEEARAAQEPLFACIDALITTQEDARRVLGVTAKEPRKAVQELANRYGFKTVTMTVRDGGSVRRNQRTAVAWSGGTFFDDRTYDIEIVDGIGGGDAYAAGFIKGLLVGDIAKGVREGNAFSALKQTSWGDFPWATFSEVEALVDARGAHIVR